MNNEEAKFILGAYRPNGHDAEDAKFAEALAHAEREPELRMWWEKQRRFDQAVSNKLKEVAPPAELQASILAGSRASRPPTWRWRGKTTWLAAAAGVALLLTVSVALRQNGSQPTMAQLAVFAMKDLAESHSGHVGYPPELADLQARMANASRALSADNATGIDLDELRRKNCRIIKVAGREVFEICFRRDGVWYHLYAARRADFAPSSNAPSISTSGELSVASWADAKNAYALVTSAGRSALQRLI